MLAYILTFIWTFGPTWPITTEPHLLKSYPRFLATRSFFFRLASLRSGPAWVRTCDPFRWVAKAGHMQGRWVRRTNLCVMCDFFSFHVCVSTSYIFLAVPASIACNYNYGTAGRLETCKILKNRNGNFDIWPNKHTVRRLNEHKIWGKQHVL